MTVGISVASLVLRNGLRLVTRILIVLLLMMVGSQSCLADDEIRILVAYDKDADKVSLLNELVALRQRNKIDARELKITAKPWEQETLPAFERLGISQKEYLPCVCVVKFSSGIAKDVLHLYDGTNGPPVIIRNAANHRQASRVIFAHWARLTGHAVDSSLEALDRAFQPGRIVIFAVGSAPIANAIRALRDRNGISGSELPVVATAYDDYLTRADCEAIGFGTDSLPVACIVTMSNEGNPTHSDFVLRNQTDPRSAASTILRRWANQNGRTLADTGEPVVHPTPYPTPSPTPYPTPRPTPYPTPTPPPPPLEQPRVYDLDHNGPGPLSIGQTFVITAHGTAGCRASYSIGSWSGMAMTEVSPGSYRGQKTVRPGDQADNCLVSVTLQNALGTYTINSPLNVSMNGGASVSGSPPVTAAGDSFNVIIINNTPSILSVAVHYMNQEGEWVTEGFWEIQPGAQDSLPIRPSNPDIFFHAHDSNGHTWGKDHSFTVSSDNNDHPFTEHTMGPARTYRQRFDL